ncbi:hypothetical protein DYB32_006199 [Aphanomyces invadans]|uniref:Uncharacterized protein n=1 Tax=Aphanomyces invadans TaxID=157072 RepID=A0A3R6YX01_9STRA|nr:hypothetical protein DYB32_006199 [Aphanomyces invadans]
MPYVVDASPLSSTHAHHPKSRSRAELSKVSDYLRQQMAVQKKKAAFTTEDVVQALSKKFPDLNDSDLVAWGETLVTAQLLLGPPTAFKDKSALLRFPDKTAKKLSASERSKLSDLMSSPDFDAKAYAESFLKRNPPDKIDMHCDVLLDQKDVIIHELKTDICANYSTFLVASTEIRQMENNVSLMRAALLDCKRALQLLKATSPLPAVGTPPVDATTTQSPQGSFGTSHGLAGVVSSAVHRFVRLVTTEGGTHHLHRDRHVLHLLQLDQVTAATALCLTGYARRMVGQVQLVKPTGNVLQYVLALSRAIFTTLLMCYEDFLVVYVAWISTYGVPPWTGFRGMLRTGMFEGHKSGPFVSFTVWMTDQLSHFAAQVSLHVFESVEPSLAAVSRDVAEFKASTKLIATSLRHIFYGARQLELAGLPIAAYLAPHFQHPLIQHIRSYAKTIKRERWDLVTMKLRSDDKDKDIALCKSARVFSGYVQQFVRVICLHDRLSVPEIRMTILYESELVAVQYMQDVKAVVDNPKTTSSIKYAQVANMLVTMQHFEAILFPKVEEGLRDVLPASLVEKAAFGSKNEVDDVVARLMQLMLVEIANDDATWTTKTKMMGSGGASQFLAEIRMLSKDAKTIDLVEQKLRQAIHGCGKKGVALASDAWFNQYEVAVAKT